MTENRAVLHGSGMLNDVMPLDTSQLSVDNKRPKTMSGGSTNTYEKNDSLRSASSIDDSEVCSTGGRADPMKNNGIFKEKLISPVSYVASPSCAQHSENEMNDLSPQTVPPNLCGIKNNSLIQDPSSQSQSPRPDSQLAPQLQSSPCSCESRSTSASQNSSSSLCQAELDCSLNTNDLAAHQRSTPNLLMSASSLSLASSPMPNQSSLTLNCPTPKGGRFTNLYNSFTPSYQSKLERFRRLFRGTPVDTDRFIVDSSCALSKNNSGLLLQGRMYITDSWVCFYAKIVYEQKIYLSVKEIVSITKEKTVGVFPNAIEILYSHNRERFFFTSFPSRARTFAVLQAVWKKHREHQPVNVSQILRQLADFYGSYSLALAEDDDTDGDADADSTPNEYCNHPLQDHSDSSMSSQLNGAAQCQLHCDDKSVQSMQVTINNNNRRYAFTDDECSALTSQKSCENVLHLSDANQSTHHKSSDVKSDTLRRRCRTPDFELNAETKSMKKPSPVENNHPHQRHLLIQEKKKHLRKRHLAHRGPTANIEETGGKEACSIECMPVTCSSTHDHTGRTYLNMEVYLNVDVLFRCLFTDSQFFNCFTETIETFDMVQAHWPDIDSVFQNFSTCTTNIERTITYTVTLKQKLGPRTCSAVEEQTLLVGESEPGKRYVIDTKVTNQALPLCNDFYVMNRYCLLRMDQCTTRLLVHSSVVHTKSMFFPAKRIIESSCASGLTDYFEALSAQLRKYTQNLSIEERRTGSWLACKRGILYSKQMNNVKLKSHDSCNLIEDKKDVNKANRMDACSLLHQGKTGLTNNLYNDIEQTVPSIPTTCNTDTKHYTKFIAPPNNTRLHRKLFSYADISYLFLRPDRAWLLLAVISLLLCLCLSLVYNRLIALERLAEQFSSPDSVDNSHSLNSNYPRSLLNGNSESVLHYGHNKGQDRMCFLPPTKLKVMKDLVLTLSKTLDQLSYSTMVDSFFVLDWPVGAVDYDEDTDPMQYKRAAPFTAVVDGWSCCATYTNTLRCTPFSTNNRSICSFVSSFENCLYTSDADYLGSYKKSY